MRGLILLSAFLLSGCWTGANFYAATDAVTAIPPGKYYDALAERSKTGRVSIEPTGMTKLLPDGELDGSILGFLPLDSQGTKFVTWISEDFEGKPMDDVGIYGLLVHSGGEFSFYMPDCSNTAEIAVAAGARFEKGMTDICEFPDRRSLERALREWQPKPSEAMARFTPIGD